MAAKYLIRFDDVCASMNWQVWEQVESILLERGIKPILAVVPDNRDENLNVSPSPEEQFWDRVRTWRSRGWTIGMHGWQHRFATKNSGILKINNYSEFAGLPRPQQEQKLRSGIACFQSQGLPADLWIAPAHSFDQVTLQLLSELDFRYISDGFSLWPYVDKLGLQWIPQQLWGFRRRPFGVWTVCYHINSWSGDHLAAFASDTALYRGSISHFDAVTRQYRYRRKGSADRLFEVAYEKACRTIPRVKQIVRSSLKRARHQTDSTSAGSPA